MLYAIIESDTETAVQIMSKEEKDFILEHYEPGIFKFVELPQELEGIGLGIRKYKINEEGNGLIYSSELHEKFKEMMLYAAISKYRPKRDELLKQSDWTQIPNNRLSDEIRLKWENYRQYLRDFPQSFIPDIDDNGVVLNDINLPSNPDEYELMLKNQ